MNPKNSLGNFSGFLLFLLPAATLRNGEDRQVCATLRMHIEKLASLSAGLPCCVQTAVNHLWAADFHSSSASVTVHG